MAENIEKNDEAIGEIKESKKAAKARAKEEKKLKKQQKNAEINTDSSDFEEEKAGSKLVVALITIFLILLWLLILGVLIKTDVGGFGTNVLKPVLQDVPYVNKILPGTSSVEETVENPDYPYQTVEEAIEQIKKLQLELQEANTQIETDTATIEELQAEIERLKTFEENQVDFQNLKTEFYEEVVFGENALDISEYQKYYESIDPENAELLYKQVVEQVAYDEEVKNYASTYAAMKPKQAAAILEELSDNLNLVAQILEAMDTESRGSILGAMDSQIAAKVTKLMAPKE